jgi:hypothetical protein
MRKALIAFAALLLSLAAIASPPSASAEPVCTTSQGVTTCTEVTTSTAADQLWNGDLNGWPLQLCDYIYTNLDAVGVKDPATVGKNIPNLWDVTTTTTTTTRTRGNRVLSQTTTSEVTYVWPTVSRLTNEVTIQCISELNGWIYEPSLHNPQWYPQTYVP